MPLLPHQSVIRGNQGRKKLKQRPWRSATCWLALRASSAHFSTVLLYALFVCSAGLESLKVRITDRLEASRLIPQESLKVRITDLWEASRLIPQNLLGAQL